jgi:antitoxin component YwqK of YwqJK toxin-antitoxin module
VKEQINIIHLFLFLVLALPVSLEAQKKKDKPKELKVKETRLDQNGVLDTLGEISLYNPFTPSLNGDSIRLFPNGEKLQGWKEDVYLSGKPLHKGFYKNGQLEMFKNFWENGKTERVMAVIDSNQSNLEVYFENGNQKRQVNYFKGKIKRYSEFFPNNLLKITEEYDPFSGLIVKKKTWHNNGQIASELTLQDQKSKKYKLTTYHQNGKLAESGFQFPAKDGQSYTRKGIWTLQDSLGKKKNKNYAGAK